MSHEPYAELAPAYALGALDGEDRLRFEAHLRQGCPQCEAALAESAETLAAVAAELPRFAQPAGVRARLLERAAAEAPDVARATRVTPAVPPRSAPRPRSASRSLLWGTGLAAAAIVAYLSIDLASVRRELAERTRAAAGLEAEARRSREEVEHLRAELTRQQDLLALLAAPETRVVALAGQAPSPSARGRMWWHAESRRGFIVATGLPPAPEGKTYQLWVISAGKPLPAGTFDVDRDGHSALPVGPVPDATTPDVFAVTLEPAGGLPAPSGPMYLAGQPA